MATIYYQQSTFVSSQEVLDEHGNVMIEVVLNAPPDGIVIFDSVSSSTANLVSASYSLTSSYASNATAGTTVQSGSILPITASWAYTSIIGGSGKSAGQSWDANKFVAASSSWSTGSAISMSVAERVPFHIWTTNVERPFLIPDPIRIPINTTHLRFKILTRVMSGSAVNGSRFCVKIKAIHQHPTEAWSNEISSSQWEYFDVWNYTTIGRTQVATFEVPLSDFQMAPGDFTKFWFARDTGSYRNSNIPQDWGIYSINIEPFTARPIPSGSLKEALISKSMAVVSGRSYATYTNRFLSKDTASAAYVLSGSRLDNAAGFDASGFQAWGKSRSGYSPGAMISNEHAITVKHYKWTNGDPVHYVDNTGTTHTRSVYSTYDLTDIYGSYPDITIHRLNSPLPAQIATYKVAGPEFEKYVVQKGRGIPAWTYYGIGDNFAVHEIDRIFRSTYPTGSGLVAVGAPSETSASLSSWYQECQVGQSGSPLFFIMPDGEVVFIGCWNFYAPAGKDADVNSPISPYIYNLINTAMTSLGSSGSAKQLIPYDFSSYPVLTDYGYET